MTRTTTATMPAMGNRTTRTAKFTRITLSLCVIALVGGCSSTGTGVSAGVQQNAVIAPSTTPILGPVIQAPQALAASSVQILQAILGAPISNYPPGMDPLNHRQPPKYRKALRRNLMGLPDDPEYRMMLRRAARRSALGIN